MVGGHLLAMSHGLGHSGGDPGCGSAYLLLGTVVEGREKVYANWLQLQGQRWKEPRGSMFLSNL